MQYQNKVIFERDRKAIRYYKCNAKCSRKLSLEYGNWYYVACDILTCVIFSQSISMHVEIKLSLCSNSQNIVRVTNMKMRQLRVKITNINECQPLATFRYDCQEVFEIRGSIMKGTVRGLVTSRGYFASVGQFGKSACVPAAARRVGPLAYSPYLLSYDCLVSD